MSYTNFVDAGIQKLKHGLLLNFKIDSRWLDFGEYCLRYRVAMAWFHDECDRHISESNRFALILVRKILK